MAAGTLPKAPLMRPSVTSATLKPLALQHTPAAVAELVQLGHAVGLQALPAHHAGPRRGSSSPALKARCRASYRSGTWAGASMAVAVVRYGGNLDHAAAQVALQQLEAAGGAERFGGGHARWFRPWTRPARARPAQRQASPANACTRACRLRAP